jgi:hypothetical protein
MPYPVVHVLFFVFCINAVAVASIVKSLFKKELPFMNSAHLFSLLLLGSFCSLLPDIMVVYNLLINGTMEHCWIGSFPTHSFLFSSTALLLGIITGYIVYRKPGRAMYLALFAESAFLSHLFLDDFSEGGCIYFYPIYNETISIFAMMDIGFRAGLPLYLISSIVSVFFLFFVIMMALLSLNHFGFEFSTISRKPEK